MAQNDDQLQQQYQEILNKYASSIVPPTTEQNLEPEISAVPENSNISNSIPMSEPELKTETMSNIDLAVEPKMSIVPETPTISDPITMSEPEIPVVAEQPLFLESKPDAIESIPTDPRDFSLPPVIADTTVPPIYFPPEPTVEKSLNFFKYLFYFSLLIFIGVAVAIVYSFLNSQQPAVPVTSIPSEPTVSVVVPMCELTDKKFAIGETFSSVDLCNTCSCTADLTIACTQKTCVSPTPVPTIKKTVGKVYKDIRYGYQFECPTAAKYVIEATSVNGNKIPYKQESCSLDGLTVTVSVYDNTVIHSFGNIETKISPDQKYVVAIEGDNTEFLVSIGESFKFL